MELHKNSSLRTNLCTRPSLRNRKRELIETEGLAEDKLLSSGTELEMSQSQPALPVKKADGKSAEYMEVLPPRPSEMPDRMKDPLVKLQARRKLLTLKRIRHNRNSSLKGRQTLGNPLRRNTSSTLSFRSELANRIKRTSLGQFQAQSMFDLRSDDPLEVEMLYENLLGAGDISEDDDDSIAETLDDLSVLSDSTITFASENTNSISSLQAAKSRLVESLSLPGSGSDSAQHAALASNSSGSAASAASMQNITKRKGAAKLDAAVSGPPGSRELGDLPTPPPSPHIASIRAHTMRKSSVSNAVMVLSGGDGYWDMHSGGSSSKSEDASLLFWIYKF